MRVTRSSLLIVSFRFGFLAANLDAIREIEKIVDGGEHAIFLAARVILGQITLPQERLQQAFDPLARSRCHRSFSIFTE